jgi:hypothetical protein
LVSGENLLRVNKTARKKTLNILAPAQTAQQHVQFNMLTQKVFAAHASRGQHPHAHEGLRMY